MTKTKVVNKIKDHYDVDISRAGQWGNPFHIGPDGTREQVIQKYRAWIVDQPELMAPLLNLRGKRLGCYCHPLPCHGDVLVELIAISDRLEAEQEAEDAAVRCQRIEEKNNA